MPAKILKPVISFLFLSLSIAIFSFVLSLFQKNIFLLFDFSFAALYFFAYLLLSFAFFSFAISLANILIGDWKIRLGIAGLSSLAFFIRSDFSSLNLLSYGIFLAGLLFFIWQLNQNLKKKIDFDVKQIFLGPQRRLEFFLIIVTTISFYNIFNLAFKDKGFEIPLRLIEPITKMIISFGGQGMGGLSGQDQDMPNQQMPSEEEIRKTLEEMKRRGESPIPGLDLSKIDLSKIDLSKMPNVKGYETDNPDLSETLDPKNLEQTITNQIKTQIDKLIGPYKDFIAIALALLLFLTLLPFRTPIIFVTFLVLSGTIRLLVKLKVIEFVKEMVEIRRLKVE